jgi:hypothetical protein
MKKTSNKVDRYAAKWGFPDDTHPQTPLVLFIFGIVLILIYLFKTHHNDWLPKGPEADPPGYVWVDRSPDIEQGLYVLTANTARGYMPAHGVTAIHYDRAGEIEQISLPAKVANIFFRPIAINSADRELLCTLPGIGPVLAERILARRNITGGFKDPQDLLQVKGIGPKKLARLLHHILIN